MKKCKKKIKAKIKDLKKALKAVHQGEKYYSGINYEIEYLKDLLNEL